LRESEEEIGIGKDRVRVLGEFSQLPSKTGSTKVTTIVGYLGEIDMSNIKFNSEEVSDVFSVPIANLTKPTDTEHFRMSGILIPSWVVSNHRIWGN
jgi:8-oxo-dGTP pyrophosphatase MutT (NUDIX family)